MQPSPSSHALLLFVCTQPDAGTQLSVVQPLPSSQFGATLPTHEPDEQASTVVHALPSSHVSVVNVCLQPMPIVQLSAVQPFLSSQSSAPPPVHVPLTHLSPTVHGSLSLQDALLYGYLQPPTGSHWSSVHGLPSLQVMELAPEHLPALQASPVVHALASSHATTCGVCVQPCVLSQSSSVQGFASSQFAIEPPLQTPEEQFSPVVHLSPSSQTPELGTLVQPPFESQESTVHGLPSEQSFGLPPQLPEVHLSADVQMLPSSQYDPSVVGALTQPFNLSQESVVQVLRCGC